MRDFLKRHVWLKHFDDRLVSPMWYVWIHTGTEDYWGIDFRAGLWELRLY